jgi:RNA polymerase subunit RPABC4/transcription elongation factor Spt4
MKCANCGKEFGEGTNCQHCGVDRVTGLANYSGYDNHARNCHHTSSNQMEYISNSTTACYACGEIIPSDAEYCPYCRKKLYDTCPKCGKKYSSQFDNCPKCGTNRHDYYLKQEAKKQEERRREREEQYKMEAQDLRESLTPRIGGISTALISAWLVYCFTPSCPVVGHGYNSLFLMIGVSVLLFLIAAIICDSIGNKKIRKWKEEHPNDPRSKYL